MLYQFLDIALAIHRTVLTSCGHGCLADCTLEVIAVDSSFANQAGVWVLGQDEREDLPTHVLQSFRIRAHNHAIGNGDCAGGGETAHILDLNNT
jgi:hypothetical protein